MGKKTLELTERARYDLDAVRVRLLDQKKMNANYLPGCFAVVPGLISPHAFNLASSAESIIETYYKLRYYIDEMPNLKVVVIPVSLASFSTPRKQGVPHAGLDHYMTLDDVLTDRSVLGSGVVAGWTIGKCPILSRRGLRGFTANVVSMAKGAPIGRAILHDGYRRYDGSHVTDSSAAEMARAFFKSGYGCDPNMLLYFERTLRLCKTQGVRVITVSCPLTDTFMKSAEEYLTREALLAQTVEAEPYRSLIDTHLDFMTFRSEEHDLFCNPNHLNYRGAVAFSPNLREALRESLKDTPDAGLIWEAM